MAIPNPTKQALSDYWVTLGKFISLHTAAAGTTGANEANGGGYSRVEDSFTPGSTGVNTSTGVEVFCGAGTYVEGGMWSAVTNGTFRGSVAFAGGSIVVVGTGASITVTTTLTIN